MSCDLHRHLGRKYKLNRSNDGIGLSSVLDSSMPASLIESILF